MDRRKLLAGLMGFGGTVIAAVIAIPSLLAALHPGLTKRESEAWREVGNLTDFEVGKVQPAKVSVGREDWSRSLDTKLVYVWRRDDDAETPVVVYSRNCTDLSCPVHYDAGSECFFCPCHGGIFNKEGKVLAGPPPVPLYRYAVRIREGKLEIDLRSLPPMT